MAKIKNAIIINGVTYELVKFGNVGNMCSHCDLFEQCKEQSDTICNLFPLSDTAQYHFKKVNAEYEYTKERKEIEIRLKD